MFSRNKPMSMGIMAIIIMFTLFVLPAPAGEGEEEQEVIVDGWKPQTHASSRAMEKGERATDPVKPTNHVLKVYCNFDPTKRGEDQGGLDKGEATRDLRPEGGPKVPGLTVPANFKGCTLKCKVYVTKGALGSPNAPNGFQLILKSVGWNSYYSTWIHVPKEEEWFKVTAEPPAGDWVEKEFDVTNVIMVGVKMGLNDYATKPFKGVIFLDDFQVIGPDGKTIIAKWDFEPTKEEQKK